MEGIRRIAWIDFLVHRPHLLWWVHSAWSLLWGVGFLWLGSRSYATLRVAVYYLGFIWISGLLLPWLARLPALTPAWRERVRLAVNYLHRNFYQQMLFFVLPVYWRSATLRSGQVLWLGLLLLGAVLATLDVVYDRALSRHWFLLSTFFSFTLFAVVGVMVPVLFHLPTLAALGLAALIAWGGFASFCWCHSPLPPRQKRLSLAGGALVLLALVSLGRGWIPPAPLRLASATFGLGIDGGTLALRDPLMVAGGARRLVVLTAIHAPSGLADRIRHRWLVGGRSVYVSPLYRVAGGRRQGYRLWTRATLPFRLSEGDLLQVRVETGAGQLVGLAELPGGDAGGGKP